MQKQAGSGAFSRGSVCDMDKELLKQSMEMFLKALGEDPKREGLLETPERVARMYAKFYEEHNIKLTIFKNEEGYNEMIIKKDIELFSLCEHHLLPFTGSVAIGYIPNRHYVGLSKLSRIVNMFAYRPQIQERLTTQIAGYIEDKVRPMGVGVIIKARHMCVGVRGVMKPNAEMITSDLRGEFRDGKAREEFLHLCG